MKGFWQCYGGSTECLLFHSGKNPYGLNIWALLEFSAQMDLCIYNLSSCTEGQSPCKHATVKLWHSKWALICNARQTPELQNGLSWMLQSRMVFLFFFSGSPIFGRGTHALFGGIFLKKSIFHLSWKHQDLTDTFSPQNGYCAAGEKGIKLGLTQIKD